MCVVAVHCTVVHCTVVCIVVFVDVFVVVCGVVCGAVWGVFVNFEWTACKHLSKSL